MRFERQLTRPIVYEDVQLDAGLRLDFLVEDWVVVEVEAVDKSFPVHKAQVLTYLQLSGSGSDCWSTLTRRQSKME